MFLFYFLSLLVRECTCCSLLQNLSDFTGIFFPFYRVAILKKTRAVRIASAALLVCASEQRLRHYSGIMKDGLIALIFFEIRDQLYLPV
jgi:hypothetical protein